MRFLFFGGSAAALNVVLIWAMVDLLKWNTVIWRNLANVASVELSLLYSYVVYRVFVWNDLTGSFRESIPLQLLKYHGSAGAAIVTRWFLLFPLLDLAGTNYLLNTVIGAAVSCVLNFVLSSRFVFVVDKPIP